MYCSNCGNQISDSQNFCAHCGNKVVKEKMDSDSKIPSSTEGIQSSASKEFPAILKILGISIVISVIAIPIGLDADIRYAANSLPGGDINEYISANKAAHMRRIFFSAFLYSFLGILIVRYLYKSLSKKKGE